MAEARKHRFRISRPELEPVTDEFVRELVNHQLGHNIIIADWYEEKKKGYDHLVADSDGRAQMVRIQNIVLVVEYYPNPELD